MEAAAKAKGEKLWRMPLAEEYKPNIKSEIADLKNVGGRVRALIVGQPAVDRRRGAVPSCTY